MYDFHQQFCDCVCPEMGEFTPCSCNIENDSQPLVLRVSPTLLGFYSGYIDTQNPKKNKS